MTLRTVGSGVAAIALVFATACGGEESTDSVTATQSDVSETAPVTEAEPEVAPETDVETEPTEPEAQPVETEPAEPPTSGEPLASVGRNGFVTYEAIGETWGSVGAEITNNTDDDLFFVEVTYNFVGADGTPVATESSYLDVIPAGESAIAVGSTTTNLAAAQPVTVEITVFAEEDSFFESDWVYMEVGPDVVLGGDDFSPKVAGTVTNPTDQPVDFFTVDCLLVNDNGDVVTAVSAYAGNVAPGQTTAWETSGSDIEGALAAGATTAECSSIATLDGSDSSTGSSEGSSGEGLASVGRNGFVTYEAIGETWGSVGAEITNNTDDDLFFVEVTYNFVGADGTPVATESSYLDVIPAGESAIAVGSTTTNLAAAQPVTVEITVFAEEDSFFESDWVYMEVGPDVVLGGDDFSPKVAGTVTNPTDQPVDFFTVDCLLVNDNGDVVTAVSAYADRIAPGQTTAWETSGSDIEGALAAGATTAECSSITTLDD